MIGFGSGAGLDEGSGLVFWGVEGTFGQVGEREGLLERRSGPFG